MQGDKLQLSFFFLFFGFAAVLTFFVFLPFLDVLILSAIFALLLYPLYQKVLPLCGKKESITAALVIVIALIFLVVPLAFLGTKLFGESKNLYQALQEGRTEYLQTVTLFIENPIRAYIPNFSIDVHGYLGKIFDWIGANIGPLVTGTAQILLKIFLATIALFFFLRDGARFAKTFISLSPLNDVYDREIIRRVGITVNSVMRGTLLIAIVQGILVGIGLVLFGVPNPTLWGSIAALTALIPGIGTALVVIPAVLYLIIIGDTAAAIGFAIWGFFLVGLIDNILRPYFYSRGVKIHPLFVLFSVLGGLIAFGPIGFLLGPLILSLFLALLHVYRILILKEESKEGL
jgi:predicted PurR-regulated permease PerM